MRWKPQLLSSDRKLVLRREKQLFWLLATKNEHKYAMRQTPVSLRDEATKKKKLYEKGVRSSDVQEKNENAGGNIRFSVLQLRMLTQIFYSHWSKKKEVFSDGQGLPSKCIFSRYGTHACVRIPTASCHVCVSSRNITCVYKAFSTVLSHSTSSLQLRFELIFFILLYVLDIFKGMELFTKLIPELRGMLALTCDSINIRYHYL